jgi:hypothetical protein
MTKAVSEWLALDVRDIDEKKLLPGFLGKDGMKTHLPTQIVQIPFDDPDQVAVVSWRWDGDLQTKGSRNVASVVNVAKQRGIRYLFIDIISIDQTLPIDDLIEQVVAFSTLYTKITILATYDMYGEDRRHQNSGTIIYVGHARQGCTELGGIVDDGLQVRLAASRVSVKDSYFGYLLDIIWRTSFIESIIGVLLEDVGMSSILDFKYIIHAYSHILSVAYEQMERNDYLLTTAILCHTHGEHDLAEKGVQTKRNIEKLRYCRYRFTPVSSVSSGVWEYYKISLDGTTVALWRIGRHHQRVNTHELDQLPGTNRVIFAALGLTGSEYEDFVGAEEARLACLLMNNGTQMPPPALKVVEVDLPLDLTTA